MKKKQYIIPNTAIELLQTERMMGGMASISNKGGYGGGGAPERRTKAF